MVSGWSRAEDVDGVADNDYAVYVDINDADGSHLWGQTAPFATGTHPKQAGRLAECLRNAADHPYWENPALYNRPLVQRLSAAGWEPVTYARSTVPSVWLERYGTNYLSVLNSGNAPAEMTIQIDTARFFPGTHPASARLVVRDIVSGQTVLSAPLNRTNSTRVSLAGQETRVLSLGLISEQKRTNE